MKKNTRIVLSIIGLVFMLAFTIMTVISLYDTTALGGSILYIALGCGLVGIGVYLAIMQDNRAKARAEENQKIQAQNAKDILENSETNSQP